MRPLSPDQREMVSNSAGIAPYAMQHGCGAKTGPMDVGNTKEWWWPNCGRGYTYSYFLAPGQHADTWDKAAVLRVTQEMLATEQ